MSNVAKGNEFQERARRALEDLLKEPFDKEVRLPIGNPPRPHSFDLVSASRQYVAECKAFTYTRTGRNPSAKITTLREALQYLHLVPGPVTRLLVMDRHHPEDKRESLAEHFARLNGHLRGSVTLLEMTGDGTLRVVAGETPPVSTYHARL